MGIKTVLLGLMYILGVQLDLSDSALAFGVCTRYDLPEGLKYDGDVVGFYGMHIGYSGSFLCYDIYHKSRTTIKCVAPRTWSDPSPPCKPIECPPPPSVSHGKVECKGWGIGNTASYACDEGYWYDGENPRICQRNRTWSGSDGGCQEIECPSLTGISNGSFSPPPPYKYQARLKASCDPGFVYNGSQELVCRSNNTWGGTLGQCLDIAQIRCTVFLPSGPLTVTPILTEARYQDSVHVTCPKVFTYNGTATRTCQHDGTWSGKEGTCNVDTCPPYTPPGIGGVKPACSPCKYRDRVRVVCPEGYSYNGSLLMCDDNGKWTGTRGICNAISCEEDVVIPFGCMNGSGSVFLDEVNITCDPGYTWIGGQPVAVCAANGTWDVYGNCTKMDAQHSLKHQTSRVHILVPVLITAFIFILVICSLVIYKIKRKKNKAALDRVTVAEMEPLKPSNQSQDKNDGIKRAVLKGGHIINRDQDKKINLDTQYISLRVVSGKYSMNVNDFLPDHYQDYLQKAGGENIRIENLLKYVKDELLPLDNLESKQKSRGKKDQRRIHMKKRKPLLLEGRGGVGKSTLVQKLMRLWAQNKWATEYKAAFLFNMRSLTVVDKRPVSLEDFFRFFGVYMLRNEMDIFTKSILKKENKIIIFIDGVDEFPGLAEKLGQDKDKIEREAEPLTWCLDILRRDVLGSSVLILASRPFRDLAAVHCDPILEVVGLTRETILDFIDHHVAADCVDRVRTAMTGNPLVMSVSSITYFCMLFCQVLEEDSNVSMEDLTTYTRIVSFFMLNYLSRCPDSLFVEPSCCLPPLAQLAYNGLVENRVNEDLACLVFVDKDLVAANVSYEQVKIASSCGILLTYGSGNPVEDPSACQGALSLTIQDEPPVSKSTFTHEFVHLSVQELLAMMEFYQRDRDTLMKTASMMWESPSFNMAKMFFCGIIFDIKSCHIRDLKESMSLSDDTSSNGSNSEDHKLVNIIANRQDTQHELLHKIQAAYETQNPAVVRLIAAGLFRGSDEMEVSNTLLTAIDINAITYMLQQTTNIVKLRLGYVTLCDQCVNLLLKFLKNDKRITQLSIEGTELSAHAIQEILQVFGMQQHQKNLSLYMTGIGDESVPAILEGLQPDLYLTSLSLAGLRLSKTSDFRKMMESIKSKQLTMLDLNDCGITEDRIRILAEAIKVMHLQDLRLSRNNFNNLTELHHLMEILENTKLTALNLSDTGIEGEGVGIVLEAVSHMDLSDLRLCSIQLTREEVLTLIKGANQKLEYLGLQNTIDNEAVVAVATALRNNKIIEEIDLRGETLSEDSIKHVMKGLIGNTSLKAMWLSGLGGTCTLLSVPGTDRRIKVDALPSQTMIAAWIPDDVKISCVLIHDKVAWGGGRLEIHLKNELSSTYGYKRPAVRPDVWPSILKNVTEIVNIARVLVVWMPSYVTLDPILNSIRSHFEGLSENEIRNVEVGYGMITCCDLYSWWTEIITQTGWSIRPHTNKDGIVDCAEIRNSDGQSLGVRLVWTDIKRCNQEKHDLKEMEGLLYEPKYDKR